jgi:flagellar motor component MotA
MISWVGAFHSVLMPNPQDMVTMTEAKSFSQPEKQELFTMTAKIMKLIRSNSVAGINKDKKREAQFIEDSFKLWNSELKPLTAKFEQKLYDTWKVQ